jgi:DNA-directed RNA polymerase subunit M/transcription elongation factor TFIIS
MNEAIKCAKCGSDKIIPRVPMIDKGHYSVPEDLTIQICENPDALIFKSKHTGKLHAMICGNCGYVETYIDNQEELYSTYINAKAKGLLQ